MLTFYFIPPVAFCVHSCQVRLIRKIINTNFFTNLISNGTEPEMPEGNNQNTIAVDNLVYLNAEVEEQ